MKVFKVYNPPKGTPAHIAAKKVNRVACDRGLPIREFTAIRGGVAIPIDSLDDEFETVAGMLGLKFVTILTLK